MNREKAIELLHKHIKAESMIRHSLASEAVMRALAIRLNENADDWALAGLLHDIDVEKTHADPKTHGPAAKEILEQAGAGQELIDAIIHHNEMAEGIAPRTSRFQHALAAGETITGLISATALVYPDKKVGSVKTKSVLKRMKEKKFAASIKRENIMECEKLGLTIQEFAELALNAMKNMPQES